jgi:antitoxin HicB
MAEPKRGRTGSPGASTRRRGKPRKSVKRTGVRKRNPHRGTRVDEFLREEGIYEEAHATALKEVVAWQLAQAMKERSLSKAEMARRMKTSRAAVDRLLDVGNRSATLSSLTRAAAVLGKELRIELVDRDSFSND